MTEACVEPGWRVNDIVLAAKVLQNAQPSPSYANEAEMRRVFGLVYDVLRCEIVFEYKRRQKEFLSSRTSFSSKSKNIFLI